MALMLLYLTKLDEALAGIQRRPGQSGIEHSSARPASIERQFHQPAADTAPLVLVADDHHADCCVLALRTGDDAADQLSLVLHYIPLAEALQHGPVLLAMRPLQVDGKGVSSCDVGSAHRAIGIVGATCFGHDCSP
ncbi:hypothetical protein D9M68_501260 [compost metagenome]